MNWLIPIGIAVIGFLIQIGTSESTTIFSDGSSEDTTSYFGATLFFGGIIWLVIKVILWIIDLF